MYMVISSGSDKKNFYRSPFEVVGSSLGDVFHAYQGVTLRSLYFLIQLENLALPSLCAGKALVALMQIGIFIDSYLLTIVKT